MALSANTVLETRTTGNDTNGGGWVTGSSGVDRSQQDSPQYAVTDGVTAGTTAITSATANFGTDVVGNLVYVAGGTGSVVADWYHITARPSATEITVDRSTGLTAGTGVTVRIGGALASPGLAAKLMTVSGMRLWIKAGAYSITTETLGAGSRIVTTSSVVCFIGGYDQARGDHTGTRPVLTWTAAAPAGTTYMVDQIGGAAAALQVVDNLEVDGADVTNVSGFRNVWRSSWVTNSAVDNCSTSNQNGFLVENAAGCYATGCFVPFSANDGQAQLIRCYGTGNTWGFVVNGATCYQCISAANTNYGFDSAQYGRFVHCVSHGNGTYGFAGPASELIGCIATGNTQVGYGASGNHLSLYRCASHGNSARIHGTIGTVFDLEPITLSVNPFVNAAAGDFDLNTTAFGGAVVRDAGMEVPNQVNFFDVGALEATAAESGGASGGGNFRGNFQ